MRHMRNGLLGAFFTLAAALLAGCGGDSDEPEKSPSSAAVAPKGEPAKATLSEPEVAFYAALKSIEKDGTKGMMRHLTDESEKFVIGGMILALSGELAGDIEVLFTKHDLNMIAVKAELEIVKGLESKNERAMVDQVVKVGGRVKDTGSFADSANGIMKLLGIKSLDDLFPKDAKLKDVKIDGDKAQAKMVIGEASDDDLFLARQGGVWRIDLVSSLLSAAAKRGK